MKIRKNKKEQIKTPEIIPEKKALIVKEQKNATSVFFQDKIIFKHSQNKPFAYTICQKTIKEKRKNECIKKRTPLCKMQIEEQRFVFFNGQTKAIIDVEEKKDKLYFHIENQTENTLQIIVSRGTIKKREKKEKKREENSIFTTKRPNLMLNEELMLSIDTLYDWDIERTNKDVTIDIKGKRATLLFVSCQNKEEAIQIYKKEKNIAPLSIKKKEGVYLTVNRKNYIKKTEKIKEAGIKVKGLVLEDIEIREEINKAIEYAKKEKIEVFIKIKPYIPTNVKYREEKKELLLKDYEKKLYKQEINEKKYYGVDLSKEKARRWQQNLIREMLDKGIKGIIAEKAVFDKEKVDLESPHNFNYFQVWHIIWQKLIKEAIDEYPNRSLLIRNNGIKSVRYGALMTDEKSWKDIERIKKDIDKTRLLGTDEVITEVGGVLNKKEKQYTKKRKWREISKNMPIVIMGNIPEKIIERILKE